MWFVLLDGSHCFKCLIAHFFLPFSQFHLCRTAAVWRPVLSRLPFKLVCCCGLSSCPAGQPHPERAAAEGSACHQPGQAPCVSAAAVHQHPVPGRAMMIQRSVLIGCVSPFAIGFLKQHYCRSQWREQCHIIVVLQGDKIIRRVSKVYLCVCECLGGTCLCYVFGLAVVVGVLLAHLLGDLASL